MEPQKEPNPNYLPYPPHAQQPVDDEIDLRELFGALWKGKWIIIATTFVFAVSSVLYALSLPNIYKADALLAPTEASGGASLSKMAGQLGGLAALAGVNLGGTEASRAELAVQVIKSRQFVEWFIKKHDLRASLMGTKGWDLKNSTLIYNEEIYNSNTGEWLRESSGLRGKKPTAQESYEFFTKEALNITQDKESGLYTISIKHYSPYIAQQWVDLLVLDINKVMRERAIEETSQNLSYLKIQLQKTSVTEMQNTFYKLIEEQTKSLMLAEAQEEFVFKTIDKAVVPEVKDSPKRALICIIGVILGGVLGIALTLIRFAFNRQY
ncbi:Wzz/FepE/Etk N-terminal domain-containing protein [Vibrio owensii]|uniref:Wzz/FepE/Etk N-terminal domain-containing protein n=1 Tax=Vibrio owensii TaxID=696485 RepID=UPI004067CFA7